MKNLTDYIIEASSSEQKYFRFEFGDLEKADEFISSIEKIASEKDIYSEKISGGIKIKVNPSDVDKVDGIQDVLQKCLDGASEKDKHIISWLTKLMHLMIGLMSRVLEMMKMMIKRKMMTNLMTRKMSNN